MPSKLKDSKILPILLLLVILIASIFISVQDVSARSGFTKVTSIWDNETNTIEANKDTFPYGNTIDASHIDPHAGAGEADSYRSGARKSVSLDVVYGITKNLVTYHGELPWHQTHNDTGETRDGWAGYPFEDGTTMRSSENVDYGNPDFKGGMLTDKADYWGNVSWDDGDANFSSVSQAENLNKPDVTSLRLYALQHTKTGFLVWIGNLAYTIARGIAWLASMFITLVVSAKNLDMDFILDALHLEDIGKVLTTNLIGSSSGIGLSPFTGFCIIMFMFALAGYTIRWVKGAEKTKSIWGIIGTALIGAVIIGVCLAGKWKDLGGTLANAANKIIYVGASSLSASGDGDAFVVDISSSKDTNKITQMQEMALIYKPYIDIQICTQFNVNDIDTLKFSNLGDNNGTTAKAMLAGVDSANMKNDFNNNLGYYYWFANSSAKEKTAKNTDLPSTNASANNDKLSSMINYLQHQYNVSTGSQTTIIDIMDGLSNPKTGAGFLLMLGFTIVMVLLAIVLVKYAINVLIAKIELFVALIGLAVAGPLMISNKKKLVDTGKFIVGMLLIAFIEITVWSIFFDLILYTVAVMLKASMGRMLVTIAFLLLFLKFNPVIAQKIKEMLDNSTRAISPIFHQGRNAIKQKLRQQARKVADDIDGSSRLKGYDENGKEIRESRKGGLMSKMAHLAANATEDPYNRKSWHKLNSEAKEARTGAKNETNKALRDAAAADVKSVEDKIELEADNTNRVIAADADKGLEETMDRDASGNFIGFNVDKLNEDEENAAIELTGLEAEERALMNDPEYRMLKKEQEELKKHNEGLPEDEQEEMSEEKKARLEELESALIARRASINEKKSQIVNAIRERTLRESAKKHGFEKITQNEDETLEEAIAKATKVTAQQNHLAEYQEKLQAEINAHALDSENLTQDNVKIGVKGGKVNKEAITAQAAATLKLAQLTEGAEVSSTEEAKEQVKGIADHIERTRQSTLAKVADTVTGNTAANTQSQVEAAAAKRVRDARLFSKERARAKEDLANIKKVKAESTITTKAEDAAGKAVTRIESGSIPVISAATTTEQINSLIKNREALQMHTHADIIENAKKNTRETNQQVQNEKRQYVQGVNDQISANNEAINNISVPATGQETVENAESIIKEKENLVSTKKPEVETDTSTDNKVNKVVVDDYSAQNHNQTENQPVLQAQSQPKDQVSSKLEPVNNVSNNANTNSQFKYKHSELAEPTSHKMASKTSDINSASNTVVQEKEVTQMKSADKNTLNEHDKLNSTNSTVIDRQSIDQTKNQTDSKSAERIIKQHTDNVGKSSNVAPQTSAQHKEEFKSAEPEIKSKVNNQNKPAESVESKEVGRSRSASEIISNHTANKNTNNSNASVDKSNTAIYNETKNEGSKTTNDVVNQPANKVQPAPQAKTSTSSSNIKPESASKTAVSNSEPTYNYRDSVDNRDSKSTPIEKSNNSKLNIKMPANNQPQDRQNTSTSSTTHYDSKNSTNNTDYKSNEKPNTYKSNDKSTSNISSSAKHETSNQSSKPVESKTSNNTSNTVRAESVISSVESKKNYENSQSNDSRDSSKSKYVDNSQANKSNSNGSNNNATYKKTENKPEAKPDNKSTSVPKVETAKPKTESAQSKVEPAKPPVYDSSVNKSSVNSAPSVDNSVNKAKDIINNNAEAKKKAESSKPSVEYSNSSNSVNNSASQYNANISNSQTNAKSTFAAETKSQSSNQSTSRSVEQSKPQSSSVSSPVQTSKPAEPPKKPVIQLKRGQSKAVDTAATKRAEETVRQQQINAARQKQQEATTARQEAKQAVSTATSKEDRKQAKIDDILAKRDQRVAKKEAKALEKEQKKAEKTTRKAENNANSAVNKAIDKGVKSKEKEISRRQKELEKEQKRTHIITEDKAEEFARRRDEIIAERERLHGNANSKPTSSEQDTMTQAGMPNTSTEDLDNLLSDPMGYKLSDDDED